jgi:hypothetical protein
VRRNSTGLHAASAAFASIERLAIALDREAFLASRSALRIRLDSELPPHRSDRHILIEAAMRGIEIEIFWINPEQREIIARREPRLFDIEVALSLVALMQMQRAI